MCKITQELNAKIERCQAQIAATYEADFFNDNDRIITREGFQQQLEILMNERQLHGITVNSATVIGVNGRESCAITFLHERALQTNNLTIQQATQRAS